MIFVFQSNEHLDTLTIEAPSFDKAALKASEQMGVTLSLMEVEDEADVVAFLMEQITENQMRPLEVRNYAIVSSSAAHH